MSIDIALTESELAELREYTEQDDLSESVRTAVKEFIRYRQRMKLIELSDRIEMEDNVRELDEAELRRQT